LLKEATFPSEEFEELRSTWIKAMEGQIKDKSAQAHNAWSRYGNPYAKGDPRYAATLEETLAEIKALTLEEVRAFYQRFYGAQHAQFSVLGPVDKKEVADLLQASFGTWKASEGWKRVEQPLAERKPARLVLDTPDKANVSISAYHGMALGGKRLDAEDHAMALAARIFGGGPGSRLWVRLREGGGLSYSAGASYSASAYEPNANISLSAEVAPQNLGQAEKAMREELERSLREGFTAQEVDSFKQQILADRQRGRSGDAWALGFMHGQMEFQHSKDYSAQGDALYASLSAAQVNAAWRKYVNPQKLVWGIFGDQSKVK
jgi:zinc protease